MTFLIAVLALSAIVAGILVWPLMRATKTVTREHPDIAVYKDQIKQLDAEIERGLVPQEDAETTRVELARRLLSATEKHEGSAANTSPSNATMAPVMGLALFATTLISVVALYIYVGRPDLPDVPLAERREARPSQEQAQQNAAPFLAGQLPLVSQRDKELVTQLQAVLDERPDDIRGIRLLASAKASMGEFVEAMEAQSKILELTAGENTANDIAALAEYMIFAARGYVSPEAEQLLDQALAQSPSHQQARYYLGIAQAQQGKPQQAMAIWTALLREGPQDAPWKDPVRQQLMALSEQTAPAPTQPGLSGPSQEDVQAAQEMTPEERMEMIQGMVDNLSQRLATAGGTPSEWSRLIVALNVLGDSAQSEAIYNEALGVFADQPEALAEINSAAQSAGLFQ